MICEDKKVEVGHAGEVFVGDFGVVGGWEEVEEGFPSGQDVEFDLSSSSGAAEEVAQVGEGVFFFSWDDISGGVSWVDVGEGREGFEVDGGFPAEDAVAFDGVDDFHALLVAQDSFQSEVGDIGVEVALIYFPADFFVG